MSNDKTMNTTTVVPSDLETEFKNAVDEISVIHHKSNVRLQASLDMHDQWVNENDRAKREYVTQTDRLKDVCHRNELLLEKASGRLSILTFGVFIGVLLLAAQSLGWL